jgi:hypothetical protein
MTSAVEIYPAGIRLAIVRFWSFDGMAVESLARIDSAALAVVFTLVGA